MLNSIRLIWSRRWELNPRPTDYESVALPLSYAGKFREILCIMRFYSRSTKFSNRGSVPRQLPTNLIWTNPASAERPLPLRAQFVLVSPGITVFCRKMDLAVSTGTPVVKDGFLRNFSPDCKTYSTCYPA